jgi:hypothetical protein
VTPSTAINVFLFSSVRESIFRSMLQSFSSHWSTTNNSSTALDRTASLAHGTTATTANANFWWYIKGNLIRVKVFIFQMRQKNDSSSAHAAFPVPWVVVPRCAQSRARASNISNVQQLVANVPKTVFEIGRYGLTQQDAAELEWGQTGILLQMERCSTGHVRSGHAGATKGRK